MVEILWKATQSEIPRECETLREILFWNSVFLTQRSTHVMWSWCNWFMCRIEYMWKCTKMAFSNSCLVFLRRDLNNLPPDWNVYPFRAEFRDRVSLTFSRHLISMCTLNISDDYNDNSPNYKNYDCRNVGNNHSKHLHLTPAAAELDSNATANSIWPVGSH